MKTKKFKNALKEMLNEFLHAIKEEQEKPTKRLLKSAETRRILGGISAAKLQYLRISGKLPAVDADGMYLYDYSDVLDFIKSNKNSGKEVRHGKL